MKHKTGERLKKIAEIKYDGNISELARQLGMSPQSFNKYAQGETMPGGKVLKRLIAIDINLNWLLTGRGSIFIKDGDDETATFSVQGSNLAEEMAEEFGGEDSTGGKDNEAAGRVEHFFRDVNEEGLNSREANLLAEVKQFSYFLESRPLNPYVKRVLLELLIESIDQAIEQPQHGPAQSSED